MIKTLVSAITLTLTFTNAMNTSTARIKEVTINPDQSAVIKAFGIDGSTYNHFGAKASRNPQALATLKARRAEGKGAFKPKTQGGGGGQVGTMDKAARQKLKEEQQKQDKADQEQRRKEMIKKLDAELKGEGDDGLTDEDEGEETEEEERNEKKGVRKRQKKRGKKAGRK